MNHRLISIGVVLWAVAGPAGAVGNLVDVTVYDRAERRILPVHVHEGRHYVVGKPGNEYQVRVRNRTGGDILSVVSVDGVNAVSGETAAWHQTGYILGPQQSFDVKGWRKSLERVAAFFFTELPNSYAARTGRPDNVGVIGVAVFRRKVEPAARIEQLPPRSEPAAGDREDSPYPAPADAASSSSAPQQARESAAARLITPDGQRSMKSPSLGTGHGRAQTSRVQYARFERATERPEEVIAIHYDTYSNLVALGVIRAPRIASPFPGQFVPDPR
ncbi:MAG TPA: hypothetical protein VIA19_05125 [Burkholderiales bacterium]